MKLSYWLMPASCLIAVFLYTVQTIVKSSSQWDIGDKSNWPIADQYKPVTWVGVGNKLVYVRVAMATQNICFARILFLTLCVVYNDHFVIVWLWPLFLSSPRVHFVTIKYYWQLPRLMEPPPPPHVLSSQIYHLVVCLKELGISPTILRPVERQRPPLLVHRNEWHASLTVLLQLPQQQQQQNCRVICYNCSNYITKL